MGGVITGFETTTGRIIQLELGLQKKSMPEISLDDEWEREKERERDGCGFLVYQSEPGKNREHVWKFT